MNGRDDTKAGIGTRGPAAAMPYPSWNEMVARLRQDRAAASPSRCDGQQRTGWHDLVADMIATPPMDGKREPEA